MHFKTEVEDQCDHAMIIRQLLNIGENTPLQNRCVGGLPGYYIQLKFVNSANVIGTFQEKRLYAIAVLPHFSDR